MKFGPILLTVVTLAQVGICVWLTLVLRRTRALALVKPEHKPFWAILQSEMASLLHHPHTEDPKVRELDPLLEELELASLTKERRDRLEFLLEEKAKNPKESKDERNRAEFLLFAMREVVRGKILRDASKLL